MPDRWLIYQGPVAGENIRLQPRQGGGQMLSKRYRAFKDGLAIALASQWPTPPIPRERKVSVCLMLQVPARMDPANLIKPILDGLEAAGVIENDRQVTELHMWELGTSKPGEGRISIRVDETVATPMATAMNGFVKFTFGKN